ncbi:MAG: uridine kinase [Verrucomicrobia bacterium]|nr:uridine kinase [Verrucomicrobiota bacterium]
MRYRSQLVAIVGGSGSGKTWLATELQRRLGRTAARISLDDFYKDRSGLSETRRRTINYDHPRAIDWTLFESVLRGFRAGQIIPLPRYNFASHTRSQNRTPYLPKPIVLVEGLWLLRRPSIRSLFALGIFIDCPIAIRLDRRLRRDVSERGRDARTVRQQFTNVVNPMHRQFVQPQMKRADVVLRKPLNESNVEELVRLLRTSLRSLHESKERAPHSA